MIYRIGDFSKLSKTTIKTLRYYDEIDLLKPEMIDEYTGYRFYSTDQLFQLHYIQSLRQVGFSIQEIKLIVSKQSVEDIVKKRKQELLEELSTAQDQLSRLEFMQQRKQEEIYMNYCATLKELPECIVYSVKTKVRNYEDYFDIIPPIGEKIMKKYPDLKCITPEYCFITYLDGEYKERDFHIEYCEAVNEMKPDFEGVHFKKIESVLGVSVMHKGPYIDLPKAYAYAIRWIEENGYTISSYPRESYIDGIWNKDDEKDWLTEIQVPVVKNI